MTLNQKFGVLVLLPVLAVAGLVVLGTSTLNRTTSGLDTVVHKQFVELVEQDIKPLIREKMLPVIDEDLVRLQKLDHSMATMLEADRDMHQALIAELQASEVARMQTAEADADDMQKFEAAMSENIGQADGRVTQASGQFQDPALLDKYAQFRQEFDKWQQASRTSMAYSMRAEPTTAAEIDANLTASRASFNVARDLLDQLQILQQVQIDATLADIAAKRDVIHTAKARMESEGEAAVAVGDQVVDHSNAATRLFLLIGVLTVVIVPLVGFLIARGLSRTLKDVSAQLTSGAQRLDTAAAQITESSKDMADGASEQASALEETSASLEELSSTTTNNAADSERANKLAAQARQNAESGDQTMAELTSAMQGINESSDQIGKIIKVIEEIAFQTNLLALNAAVEAARAGEHGKGFAVVADEVRSLAMRASDAARETTSLIEGSVDRAVVGSQVAQSAVEVLQSIAGDVKGVADLLNGISVASREQADGIGQIGSAVSQIDMATQQNAASSEEAASAAVELRHQSRAMFGIVQELSAVVGQQAEAPASSGAEL